MLAGGEALLLTLFGALWFGSLGAGAWWLVFGLVAALREWPSSGEPPPGARARAARPPLVLAGGADASHPGCRRHPGLAPRGGGRMSQELIPRLSLYFGAEPSRPAILARLALGRPAPRDHDLALELRDGSPGSSGRTAACAAPRSRRCGGSTSCSTSVSRATAARSVPPPGGSARSRVGAAPSARAATSNGMPAASASTFWSASSRRRLRSSGSLPSPCPTARSSGPSRRLASRSAASRCGRCSGPGHRDRPPVRRHLESLAQFAEQWTGWASALRARRDRRRHARAGGGRAALARREPPAGPVVAAHQGPRTAAGPNADLFPMLDALLAAGELPTRVSRCAGPCRRCGAAALRRQLRRDRPAGAGADRAAGRSPGRPEGCNRLRPGVTSGHDRRLDRPEAPDPAHRPVPRRRLSLQARLRPIWRRSCAICPPSRTRGSWWTPPPATTPRSFG